MKQFRYIIYLIFSFVFSVPLKSAADSVGMALWWLVDDTTISQSYADKGGEKIAVSDLGVTDVRVRWDNTQDGSYGFLTLYNTTGDNVVKMDGVAGVELPAEYFADVTQYSAATYTFAIELGNYVNGTWAQTKAVSQSQTYDALANAGYIQSYAGAGAAGSHYWSPLEYSVVPEPSSALLFLFGAMSLALRRKRIEE
jgi:hypothetical protein